jgi:hypothetical protein
MRPVRCGACPRTGGRTVRFTHYRDARDPLIQRIGDYCSYCEMPKPDGPDVEHIRPPVEYQDYPARRHRAKADR